MKLLFTILFSCMITGVNAQLQQGQLMNIKFSTTEPIQKRDSVTIIVEWDPQRISTIIFEDVYTPTKEEVNKRKYTLIVKPQKTTTYQITRIYTEWEPSTFPYTIKVLDENGVEIEEDKTEQKEVKNNKETSKPDKHSNNSNKTGKNKKKNKQKKGK